MLSSQPELATLLLHLWTLWYFWRALCVIALNSISKPLKSFDDHFSPIGLPIANDEVDCESTSDGNHQ